MRVCRHTHIGHNAPGPMFRDRHTKTGIFGAHETTHKKKPAQSIYINSHRNMIVTNVCVCMPVVWCGRALFRLHRPLPAPVCTFTCAHVCVLYRQYCEQSVPIIGQTLTAHAHTHTCAHTSRLHTHAIMYALRALCVSTMCIVVVCVRSVTGPMMMVINIFKECNYAHPQWARAAAPKHRLGSAWRLFTHIIPKKKPWPMSSFRARDC